jgi:hypothetical protein
MSKKSKKFQFPPQLLNQIHECSNGFLLVTMNEDYEFEVFQNLNNPVSHLGMANFLEIFSHHMQESLRSNTVTGGSDGSEATET